MKKIIFPLLALAFAITSCGGEEPKSEEATTPTQEEVQEPKEEVPALVEIVIEGNDQMRYNLERIDVKEGQRVRLTLKHVGELPIEAMGHNWILVTPDTDKAAFAAAAMEAKDNGYIPTEAQFVDGIIAHTDMVGGGQETTIEFDAPAKGFYPYFCSFPGHVGFMKGTFYVN